MDELCSMAKQVDRHDALVYSAAIPSVALQGVADATRIYLSACLGSQQVIDDESQLMRAMDQAHPLKNLTPNGKLMPKPWLNHEYNHFLKAFSQVIRAVGIDDLVEEYRLPTLRFKPGPAVANRSHLARPYATEKMHNEMWISNKNCDIVGLHLLIFGDTVHNHLRFYRTPSTFEEAWMHPVEDFSKLAHLLAKYKPIEFVPTRDRLYAFEGSAVHATQIQPETGGRISVEMFAVLKRKIKSVVIEAPLDSRLVDHALSPSEFHRVGTDLFLSVKDTVSGVVEVESVLPTKVAG
jgi:hypothetical protein